MRIASQSLASIALVWTTSVAAAHAQDGLWDFGTQQTEQPPIGFQFRQTRPTLEPAEWLVGEDGTAPSPPNFLEVRSHNGDRTFNLATAHGVSLRDLDLSVQLRPMWGEIDQGGGLIWRCRDENNYYVARINPLESNLRLYVVLGGERHQLGSAQVETRTGTWYALRVTTVGDHISCFLDGKRLLDVTDGSIRSAGGIGLWSKSDATTDFDDLTVQGWGSEPGPLLDLRRTIELPGVRGRIDHLAVPDRWSLAIAALENGSLERISPSGRQAPDRVVDLSEPQGILYLNEQRAIVLACGGDGTVRAFDPAKLEETARVDVGDDADNLRFDPRTNVVWVGCGGGELVGLTADGLEPVARIPLVGHPESFQLDPESNRAYVNVPDAGEICVVDLEEQAVVDTWELKDSGANFPMALDPQGHRLFVACRRPARLLVFDTRTGDRLAGVPCVGDADDLFFDPTADQVLAIGGDGYVDVFSTDPGREYERLVRVPTAPGARTGQFDPRERLLYVAAPSREQKPARVLIFHLAG